MKKLTTIMFLISLALAVFLSPFASQLPDGLEKVAEDKGFLEKAEGKEVFHAPFPDYSVSFIKNERISTSLSGLIGTLMVFVVSYSGAIILKKWKIRS